MNVVDQQLVKFGLYIVSVYLDQDRGGIEIDGFDMQDKLYEFGLLEKVRVTESCGENCNCEEYGDFPSDCYRFGEEVMARVKNKGLVRLKH